PHRSRTIAVAAPTEARSMRSEGTASTERPVALIASAVALNEPGRGRVLVSLTVEECSRSSPSTWLRAVMATSYPAWAKAIATALPMPRLAPVTNATGPSLAPTVSSLSRSEPGTAMGPGARHPDTEERGPHRVAAVSPPLPMLVPESEFFWVSGSEGVLRFRRCADCRSFQHPPGPICRTCGSSDLAPEDVSGRGVLVGFTVNEHMWIPSMPPPYVIGIVAIEEDPRVRLTTNIIDVPASELAVGRRVEVRFTQVEDVWLPLFTYAAEGPPAGPVPEDERPERWVRPMVSLEKFEDKVAITGIGMS